MDGKKRLAAIVLGALLFGVIAGGTFAGINVAANRLLPAAPQQEV